MKPLKQLYNALLCILAFLAPQVQASGEAGPISLRDQGNFFVGINITDPEENGGVHIRDQMYVGYQLVAEPKYNYPLILVHGGGGQASDWFTTPDGRDGLRDYFLAAGFDVYWVDRPGYGRSPTNISYGTLEKGASTSLITFLAKSEQFAGDATNHTDPMVLNLLASSPPGPYGGNRLAAQDLGELLQRIGPAILVTYSAGAISGWWVADKHPELIAGMLAIEPAASNITSSLRKGLTFEPPLPEDFVAVPDPEGCDLQPPDQVSRLPSFADMNIHMVGAEFGLTRGLPCSRKALVQAGANVRYTYLPDEGVRGNGHLLLGELNNAQVAAVLVKLLASIDKKFSSQQK